MIRSMTAPPLQYEKAGVDTAGRWPCEKHVVKLKGEKIADACIAEPAALGVSAQDLEIIKPFTEFLSQVMKGGAELLFNVGLAVPPGYRRVDFPGLKLER
jgi:hypothetical protein